MQKQLRHVHVHPPAVVAHACAMSGRTVNNEICRVKLRALTVSKGRINPVSDL